MSDMIIVPLKIDPLVITKLEPAQGITTLRGESFIWNPDVANDLIEQLNAALEYISTLSLADLPSDPLHRTVTDTQIADWTLAYIQTHTHINKLVLDATTASFTIAQAANLANQSGVNTGDQDLSSYALKTEIPTALSQLLSDSTHRTVTDAEKASWNTASSEAHTHSNKSSLDLVSGTNTGDETATTIKSKLGITTLSGSNTGDQYIPTALSEFTDDSTHRLVTDTEKSTWNGKQDALGFTPENIANKNVNNGYCPLDSGGKVPLANLPSTLLKYQGVWNASTNTPTLTNPDLTKVGYVYNVGTAGTQFGITFSLGDWAIYNASGYVEKSDNSDDVVSVNGQTGVVVLAKGDVGLGNVDNTSDVNKPISTATQNALNLKADSASLGDYVVEMATGLSGTNYTDGWYRLYNTGWIEQGAFVAAVDTVALIKTMKYVNQVLMAKVQAIATSSTGRVIAVKDNSTASTLNVLRNDSGFKWSYDIKGTVA